MEAESVRQNKNQGAKALKKPQVQKTSPLLPVIVQRRSHRILSGLCPDVHSAVGPHSWPVALRINTRLPRSLLRPAIIHGLTHPSLKAAAGQTELKPEQVKVFIPSQTQQPNCLWLMESVLQTKLLRRDGDYFVVITESNSGAKFGIWPFKRHRQTCMMFAASASFVFTQLQLRL